MNAPTVLALLVKFKLIPKTQAEKLADKLVHGIQPATYAEAERLIEELVRSTKE